MKQIQIALHKQLKKVEKLIVKREEIYFKRSENWQNSDNGAVYESDTIELDSVKDNLKGAISSLEEMTNFKIKD
jgi:hypothetical protein